jgi:4-hydroxy-3-methylbut-2-enyl diphosphate reductase
VELCERKFPTYFISSASEIKSRDLIHHYDYPNKKHQETTNYLPAKEPVTIIITSGASCPDSILEDVITRINGFFTNVASVPEALEKISALN